MPGLSRCGGFVSSAARFVRMALVVGIVVAVASCRNDGYDTGDGKYSYLTAEFALLHTDASGVVTRASLDDDTPLQVMTPFTADWAQKGDTVYRALIYYDKVDSSTEPVNVRGVAQIPVLRAVPADAVRQMPTDPVDVESVWVSKNRKFVNVSLLLKSGSTSVDNRQSVGVVLSGESIGADGRRCVTLQLCHAQNSVPEYYTVQQYVSIDTAMLGADVVELHVNTYNGEVVKTVCINNV